MRPLELSLHGFRSYREPATFDWRGRRLVGVVGPIGSGKSTLLDAIAFSLFGKTPTFERDTKSLIHQLSDECHVELRFEVDGQIWRAARGLRRRGASGHQLERLAHDTPDAEVLESFVGERVMRQRVEQLLGMDFDAFCRSVLLAQNRFAEFLRATPTQRNEVLKGVFGYERFDAAHGAARVRSAAAEQVAASLEDERGRLSETREQLATAETELTSATARANGLRAARARVDELAETRRLAQERVVHADGRLSQLVAVAEALPDPERAGVVLDAAARADESLDQAERAAAQAEAERAAAEAAHAAVAERIGDQARFSALVRSLEHLAQRAEERARLRDELAAARDGAVAAAQATKDGVREAVARGEVAAAAVATAETGMGTAEDRVHGARHTGMAMALRATLEPGTPCPVCDQPVAVPPAVDSTTELELAESALAAARRQVERLTGAAGSAAAEAAAARERATGAAENVGRIEAEVARAVEAFGAAEVELGACKSELVDHLGTGDPHALLAERGAELLATEHERTRTAEAAATARGEVERVRTANTQAGSALARLATELAAAWGRLGETRTAPQGPEALRVELSAIGDALVERREEASKQRTTAGAGVDGADEASAALLVELGLEPGSNFADALADAGAKEATSLERVAGLHTILSGAADLDDRVTAAQLRLELTRRLASDLQPSRFLAFLLEEERSALGELGSVHLEELTGGAYRFTDDDRFDVVDLNAAGSERRADSLSGGETFLASLALALALAEMVARSGGRLDSFFLDEGFGSLDPEHLDRAMEGIGRLVAGGVAGSSERLVVLVSHVEQMRQMVEDLIILDKDDLTGDTIVCSGAAPAWPSTPV
jgi:exonuclease SbcC